MFHRHLPRKGFARRGQRFVVVFDGGVEMRCLKKEVNPDTVAVVVTGHPDVLSELAREAIEEDAYALLRKPSNTDGVPALLREASKE